jgi:16S rRNA processing protein RimM
MPSQRNRQKPVDTDYLIVGEVQRPHGVRGELHMRVMTDYPDRLSALETLYFGPDHDPRRLVGVRRHREAVLLRLEGVDDRDAAEPYRGMLVYVALEDAVPLEEGEYYLYQLVGLQVLSEDGRQIGTLVDVLETGANDVYVVDGPLGEVLLPAIPQVVRQVDVPGGRIVVRLMDGMLDEA